MEKTDRNRRFLLPASGFGLLCLAVLLVVWHESLPQYDELKPAIAAVCGLVLLVSLLLFSFWFAARNTKVSRVIAVGLRIIVGVVLALMVFQIYRDIEIRRVTRDTWMTGAVLVLTILVRFSPRIIAAVRRSVSVRRATALTDGKISRIVGETHLDLDGDAATVLLVHVQYTADGVPYEICADISPQTVRKYGKEAFIGLRVPVWYDPANPAGAYTTRIDKQLLEQPQE